ncbi:MAG: acylphosphatase [Williamsia sp.]|nr:acylphosphatase [Williamsia sp.]
MATVHLIVKGRVQGVFYRASAKKMADKTGITGKVRNREDGDVEIWATGTEERLQEFIAWCKEGPSGAQVSAVVPEWLPDQPFTGFSIVRK